jgi:hypothetical protein
MHFTTLVEPEIYVSGSFGGTHQNLCPAISGILCAQLYVLLERGEKLVRERGAVSGERGAGSGEQGFHLQIF